jgi:hypothetical protein
MGCNQRVCKKQEVAVTVSLYLELALAVGVVLFSLWHAGRAVG